LICPGRSPELEHVTTTRTILIQNKLWLGASSFRGIIRYGKDLPPCVPCRPDALVRLTGFPEESGKADDPRDCRETDDIEDQESTNEEGET
jgi:hypothetical protein